MNGGFIHLSAQLAVVEAGQQRLLRGVGDDDGIGRLAAATLGIVLALLYVGIIEPGEALAAVNPHHGIVGGCQDQVAPLLLQLGDAQVDGLHALLLLGRQQRALAHKLLVGLFQQLKVLALQRISLAVIDLTYALEEGLVERHLVLQRRQLGHHLLLYLGELGRLVGLGQGEEHAAHVVEQAAALLKSHDGVLEGGRVGIADYLGDIVALLLNGRLEGRQIVGGLDLTEVRRPIGQLTFSEERILTLSLLATANGRC